VGVTNPYLRHPALAVTTMLTVNELSHGRAMLGVGAGGAMSLGPFQLTADSPVIRVQHFLELATAVRAGDSYPGYEPADISLDAAQYPLPLYVGARGPRLNTMASEYADGAFIAGMPPYRFAEATGWARSVHPIDVALYPSVAFSEAAREHHRPEMVWSLLDSPDGVRVRFGLEQADLAAAADALRQGDSQPARALITPAMQEELMLVGDPPAVGAKLAAMVQELEPTSIGLALIQNDLVDGINQAAEAFAAMSRILETG
jgi:5,10-methylenetetrahydromethanopterin reductase